MSVCVCVCVCVVHLLVWIVQNAQYMLQTRIQFTCNLNILMHKLNFHI